jgi:hypothetical protein
MHVKGKESNSFFMYEHKKKDNFLPFMNHLLLKVHLFREKFVPLRPKLGALSAKHSS